MPIYIQRPDPFWAMKLVGGKRKKIDCRIAEPDWNFCHRLDCIGMKKHPLLAANLRDFLDGKQDTGLIIGPHD